MITLFLNRNTQGTSRKNPSQQAYLGVRGHIRTALIQFDFWVRLSSLASSS